MRFVSGVNRSKSRRRFRPSLDQVEARTLLSTGVVMSGLPGHGHGHHSRPVAEVLVQKNHSHHSVVNVSPGQQAVAPAPTAVLIQPTVVTSPVNPQLPTTTGSTTTVNLPQLNQDILKFATAPMGRSGVSDGGLDQTIESAYFVSAVVKSAIQSETPSPIPASPVSDYINVDNPTQSSDYVAAMSKMSTNLNPPAYSVTYVDGRMIAVSGVSAVPSLTDAQPGDVVQFQGAVFSNVGTLGWHSAVLESVQGSTINVIEMDGGSVQRMAYNLDDLQLGTVTISAVK